MLKFLIKSIIEVRVENKEDADKLHKELQKTALDEGYSLTAWNETHKERKVKGEVVDEWELCKATFVFNDQKEPVYPLENVEYNMVNNPIDKAMDLLPWEDDNGGEKSAF